MLIRSSSEVKEGFYLLTLGSSCHYLAGQESLTLFDCCYSAQIPLLIKRLEQFKIDPNRITKIVCTHLHPDRLGAFPYLKKIIPKLELAIFAKSEPQLRDENFVREIYESDSAILRQVSIPEKPDLLSFDEYQKLLVPNLLLQDGNILNVSSQDLVRVVPFPGHTANSAAFLFQGAQLLVVDETCGYFNPSGLHAPGGDYDHELALTSIGKLSRLDLKGICLPSGGIVTGTLIGRFLQAVIRNSSDILSESKSALADGVSLDDVKRSIFESFYAPGMSDIVAKMNRQASFDSLWQQLQEQIPQP